MKITRFFVTVAGISVVVLVFSLVPAYGQSLRAKVLQYAGKTFAGPQDPEFQAYNEALGYYVARRIQKRYGVSIDPKKYSGVQLLEIEAFLKCKKSGEPLGPFLEHLHVR